MLHFPHTPAQSSESLLVVSFSVTMSEIAILAVAVGVSCGAILVLLCIIMGVRFCRKRRSENDIELRPREQEWKDPTVWWGLESQSCSASSGHWCGVWWAVWVPPCWKKTRIMELVGHLFLHVWKEIQFYSYTVLEILWTTVICTSWTFFVLFLW